MRSFILFLFLAANLLAQSEDNSPEFFGFLRLTNTWEVDKNQSYFDVIHARLGVKGNIKSKIGYKLYFDVARNGKVLLDDNDKSVKQSYSNMLLDAFISLKPNKQLEITFGQSKVPFSSSNLRSPFGMDFILRPSITKVTPSIRDVGIKATFKNELLIKNSISVGVFNGEGDNNFTNSKKPAYAFRWLLNPIEPLDFGFNYYTGNLKGTIAHIYDLEFSINIFNSSLYAEYANRTLNVPGNDLKSNALFLSYTYNILLDCDWADALKPNLRYERLSDNNKNKTHITTIGLTLSLLQQLNSEFKINYEINSPEQLTSSISTLYLLVQTQF